MRWRMDNMALRLVSLGLALALWFAVATEKTAEAPVDAPIEFQNVPDSLEVVGQVPRHVEVWLRGSPGLVQRVRAGDVYARIDLAAARPGSRTVFLAAKDIKVPYAVQVVAVRPASFSFALEPTLHKTVTVKPRVVGRPADGHRLGAVKCEPESVVVVGPSSQVAAMHHISTAVVPVDGAEMTVMREVDLELPDPSVRLVDPRLVRVIARVEPAGR